MPCNGGQENESSNNSDIEEPTFITKFQFSAYTTHFQNILNDRTEVELDRIRMEFATLLDIFKLCFAESQRKTSKIFELKAMNAVELLKARNLNSQQDETVKDLRNTIDVLQRNLDAVNIQRRELFEEIKDVRKDIKMEDVATEIHYDCLELPVDKHEKFHSVTSDGIKKGNNGNAKYVGEQYFVKESMKEGQKGITDIKVLKNDLDILVADIKLTRHTITELKKEVRKKDVIIKGYNQNQSASDAMLNETRRQVLEIRKPMEVSLKKCKAELEREKQKFQNIYNDLQVALDLNSNLSKDIETKKSFIEELKARLEVLAFEKESAERKANAFEENLAQSQVKIEALEQKIKTLKYEGEKMKKEKPAVEIINDLAQSEKEKMEITAQERIVENLKNQIATREKKLLEVGNDLQTTVEVLQTVKKGIIQANKDKALLECEVEDLRKKLRDRNEDLKQQKEKLNDSGKEVVEIKKKLYSWVKKYQQVIEKKNKFHDLYNHMKVVNSQLEKENAILGKRQQYVVQILKEKDNELAKLVRWKGYII